MDIERRLEDAQMECGSNMLLLMAAINANGGILSVTKEDIESITKEDRFGCSPTDGGGYLLSVSREWTETDGIQPIVDMLKKTFPNVEEMLKDIGDPEFVEEFRDHQTQMLHARAESLEQALAAAKAFIDSHVADPDLTKDMVAKYAAYQEAMERVEQ